MIRLVGLAAQEGGNFDALLLRIGLTLLRLRRGGGLLAVTVLGNLRLRRRRLLARGTLIVSGTAGHAVDQRVQAKAALLLTGCGGLLNRLLLLLLLHLRLRGRSGLRRARLHSVD